MNIQAINLELSRIGYKAVKLPKPKKAKGDWVPKTAAGAKCKARMAMWTKMPKPSLSILPELLAMFGFTVKDVQPWPYCGKGNYGPALANAKSKRLALPPPWPLCHDKIVVAEAAAPRKRIFCMPW
jgi:hypothetical protein